MTSDQQTNTRKDKRLLVLLALGVMILLGRAPDMVLEQRLEKQSWGWVEYAGGVTPQRVLLAETGRNDGMMLKEAQGQEKNSAELAALLQRRRAVAVQGDGVLSTGLTPRLALLLGLPFSINRATADDLALLHGVGPKLAASIIGYREQHGRIHDTEDLCAVPGIGERLAARIAPQLAFD
ncbi:MAG: ComEA family DNA-binding protein [Desulfobulbaceae bacterium]